MNFLSLLCVYEIFLCAPQDGEWVKMIFLREYFYFDRNKILTYLIYYHFDIFNKLSFTKFPIFFFFKINSQCSFWFLEITKFFNGLNTSLASSDGENKIKVLIYNIHALASFMLELMLNYKTYLMVQIMTLNLTRSATQKIILIYNIHSLVSFIL